MRLIHRNFIMAQILTSWTYENNSKYTFPLILLIWMDLNLSTTPPHDERGEEIGKNTCTLNLYYFVGFYLKLGIEVKYEHSKDEKTQDAVIKTDRADMKGPQQMG